MNLILQLLAILLGIYIVVTTFIAATRTFVLTRSAPVRLTSIVFRSIRYLFDWIVSLRPTFEQKDSVMAMYAPLCLLAMVPTWLFLTTLGYAFIFWGMDIRPFADAFLLSGSSILTLGFATADNMPQTIVAFTEATVGLILVAMLISYLPTMYAAWSRRESLVNQLEVRAGMPPSAVELVWRLHGLMELPDVKQFWEEWERWFTEIDESHTSLAALVFFRSSRADQSWVHTAGVILDGAALYLSVLKNPAVRFLPIIIRSGVVALRHIADFFQLPYNPDPHYPADPISISRELFDAGWELLVGHGLELVDDRETAWQNFAGWRVNYDATLTALHRLTMSPDFSWLPVETFVPPAAGSSETGGKLQKLENPAQKERLP